jgi:hypothetical protein
VKLYLEKNPFTKKGWWCDSKCRPQVQTPVPQLKKKKEKSVIKFIWKHKRLLIVKAILSKMSNAGGITIPNFKLYYRNIAIKTALVLAQKQT